jgi:hypothetical protein
MTNGCDLVGRFYDGIPEQVKQECISSSHRWGFVKKLDEKVSLTPM